MFTNVIMCQWRVLIRTLVVLFGFLLLCFCSRFTHAEVVKDLRYGVALYSFFQRDYFSALTEVKAAAEQKQLPNHTANARLLEGGMSLSYGISDEAFVIFSESQQLRMSREQQLRAWLTLAKSSGRWNDTRQSEQALSIVQDIYFPPRPSRHSEDGESLQIVNGLSLGGKLAFSHRAAASENSTLSDSPFQSMLDEAIYMSAMNNLKAGQAAVSEQVIARSGLSSSHRPYYYFNKGAIFAQQQRWEEAVQSFEEAEQLLMTNTEQNPLRDRINTAAGFAYLSNGEYVGATRAFQRVALDSLVNSEALLGYGLAQMEQGNYLDAMASWQRLRQQSILLSPVQEVFLGIPYLYERLERPGIALREYEYAVGAYTSELGLIDEALRIFAEMPLADIFHFEDPEYSQLPVLRLIPLKIENHFLVHFLSLNQFQSVLIDYRDIRRLSVFLEETAEKVTLLQGINDEQNDHWQSLVGSDQPFVDSLPADESHEGLIFAPQGDRLAKLHSRFETLSGEKQRLYAELVDAENSIVGRLLVQKKHARLWARLDRAKTAIKELELAGHLMTDERRFAQRFEGLLLWNASEHYAKNRRIMRQQQGSLDGALDHSQMLLENITLMTRQHKTNSFAAKLVDIQQRIEQQQGKTDLVLNRLENHIRRLAINELTLQKTQLKSHRATAVLAVARMHDVGRSADQSGGKNREAATNRVTADITGFQSGASDD